MTKVASKTKLCIKCKGTFPKTEEFFAFKDGGKRRYFSTNCRGCLNKETKSANIVNIKEPALNDFHNWNETALYL